jgi:hypothetical protein
LISDISKATGHLYDEGLRSLTGSRAQPLKMKMVSSFKILGIGNPDTQFDNPAVPNLHLLKIEAYQT